jgi:hypothetical protein
MTTPPRLAFLALFSLTACSPATLQKEKVDDVVIAAPTAATSLVTMTAMPTSDLLRADADGELAASRRRPSPTATARSSTSPSSSTRRRRWRASRSIRSRPPPARSSSR